MKLRKCCIILSIILNNIEICQHWESGITDTKADLAMLPVKRHSLCKMEFNISYNPSIQHCWRGCDYGTGRVNDNQGRDEAARMCKRYTTQSMWTLTGELESLQDLRVHSEMFPTTPANIYRACLAGIRRQRY